MPERIVIRSPEEERLAFQAAAVAGEVVAAQCFCMGWWLAKCDVGKACESCGEPMVAV